MLEGLDQDPPLACSRVLLNVPRWIEANIRFWATCLGSKLPAGHCGPRFNNKLNGREAAVALAYRVSKGRWGPPVKKEDKPHEATKDFDGQGVCRETKKGGSGHAPYSSVSI
ncbi:hypothetical protein J1614_007369 [Plenodomus biglobosus]|nr:hypothetical protein J1614_007369 [Plenodomus biglobosus]